MSGLLGGADRTAALEWAEANGWSHDAARDAITREYRFADFAEAFGWMTRMAIVADRIDHHPEWSNVYNRVSVTLVSHDVKGLSARDMDLAQRMEAAAHPA